MPVNIDISVTCCTAVRSKLRVYVKVHDGFVASDAVWHWHSSIAGCV